MIFAESSTATEPTEGKREDVEGEEAHQHLIGTILHERYRLDGFIGEGGAGVVMHGVQLSVDRPVAIKLLHTHHRRHEEARARFQLEAKALATLNHPGCVTLYDFGYSDELDAYYMVMEYIPGHTLGEHFAAQPRDLAMSLWVMEHVCDAVRHAHAHGILHRDLKPGNIILPDSESAVVKVLDFGLAKIWHDTLLLGEERISRAGAVYGTPTYMSPEQCHGDAVLTGATDVYALGIMLYELVEGHLPFESTSLTGLLLKQVNDELPPLTSECVPPELRELIIAMTRKSASDRIGDLGEICDKLRAIRVGLSGGDAGSLEDRLLQMSGSDHEHQAMHTPGTTPPHTPQPPARTERVTLPGNPILLVTPSLENERTVLITPDTVPTPAVQADAQQATDEAASEHVGSDTIETEAFEEPERGFIGHSSAHLGIAATFAVVLFGGCSMLLSNLDEGDAATRATSFDTVTLEHYKVEPTPVVVGEVVSLSGPEESSEHRPQRSSTTSKDRPGLLGRLVDGEREGIFRDRDDNTTLRDRLTNGRERVRAFAFD